MSSLSIILPDNMAKASQEVAKNLGISRTQFIRQAIAHELANYYAKREQAEMRKSFAAMKKSSAYLKEATEIDNSFEDSELPKEKDEWWKKK